MMVASLLQESSFTLRSLTLTMPQDQLQANFPALPSQAFLPVAKWNKIDSFLHRSNILDLGLLSVHYCGAASQSYISVTTNTWSHVFEGNLHHPFILAPANWWVLFRNLFQTFWCWKWAGLESLCLTEVDASLAYHLLTGLQPDLLTSLQIDNLLGIGDPSLRGEMLATQLHCERYLKHPFGSRDWHKSMKCSQSWLCWLSGNL